MDALLQNRKAQNCEYHIQLLKVKSKEGYNEVFFFEAFTYLFYLRPLLHYR